MLSRLTSGKVHVNVSDEYPASPAFTQVRNAQVNYFRGPHPAGNAGVQIQRIDPINKGEIVWVVYPQDVIAMGRFLKGVYMMLPKLLHYRFRSVESAILPDHRRSFCEKSLLKEMFKNPNTGISVEIRLPVPE